ncbi:MAG: hypothetical protein HY840_11500 [Bacteroidetes bacterium]|nr:hypothetical protein [Bacteroidota bacterium]
MKTKSSNGQAALKENIEAVYKKSKETIRQVVDSSSKQIESAFDLNKKFIESLEKQIFNKELVDTSLISETKKAFGNSVELSEDAIDTIIDIQTSQLQSCVDFNAKLADSLRNIDASDSDEIQSLVQLIEKRLEESSNQSIENTKKMTDIYNKHLNLAINFNERFSKNINNQLQILSLFQNKNAEIFNDWATAWWKNTSKEEVAF